MSKSIVSNCKVILLVHKEKNYPEIIKINRVPRDTKGQF